MNSRLLFRRAAFVVATLAVGFFLGRGSGPREVGAPSVETTEAEPEVWTCSMHPQIKLPEPGKCPICFMDLIPVEMGAGEEEGVPRLELTESARIRAGVVVAEVRHDRPAVEVRLVGTVEYDETRVAMISAWTPGRLDRLYVDYTGILVRKGDHLAEIYSPDLIAAGQELQQALRTQRETAAADTRYLRDAAHATVEAAREKLRLLGLTSGQVAKIESGERASDHVTLYAQTGGVVIEKSAVEGDYVGTGEPIFRIADLSHVWVQLDAYESELAWLRYGQVVEFSAEAAPGRTFQGRISFLSPTLDPATRTVKVRLNVDNADGALKPGMFVRAIVHAEVDGAGGVVSEDLDGKWICPMHPEVVKDRSGSCDVCGMDLAPAAELGYVSTRSRGEGPLVVPKSAVLFTGKRAIVYVEIPDTKRPTYEGREVVLGPRAGDVYVVEEGLEAGERVVVNGNFKIDSALQIQAKPSMMSPPARTPALRAGRSSKARADAAFQSELSPLFADYFALSDALASDDEAGARAAGKSLRHSLHSERGASLGPVARTEWERLSSELEKFAAALAPSEGIEGIRVVFEEVSRVVIEIERAFGHAGDSPHFLTHCAMAFDFRGAHWLQDHDRITNPYFGAAMLRCGEVQEKLE